MQSASGKTVYTNNETTHSPSSITILPSPPASANESVPLSSIPAGALQQPTIHYQQYHLPYSTHATAHSAAANTTPLQHRQSSDLAFHHISGPLSVPSSGYMPPTNSTFLIKRSVVGLKKGLISSDKYMVLCAPISIQDIQSVYELLFVSDPAKPVDARSIPWLGNVAFAAVKGMNIYSIIDKPINPIYFKSYIFLYRPCIFTINSYCFSNPASSHSSIRVQSRFASIYSFR